MLPYSQAQSAECVFADRREGEVMREACVGHMQERLCSCGAAELGQDPAVLQVCTEMTSHLVKVDSQHPCVQMQLGD